MNARAEIWHQVAKRSGLPTLVERIVAFGNTIGGRRDLIRIDRVELLLLAWDFEIPENQSLAANDHVRASALAHLDSFGDRIGTHPRLEPGRSDGLHDLFIL